MTDLVQRFQALADVETTTSGIIEGRAIPYGTIERVADPNPYTEYDEVWEHGAFALQIKHPANIGRVKFTYNHEPGWANWIGRTLYLREKPDGLYGAWQLELDASERDRMIARIKDQRLPGLSIGARVDESVTEASGLVRRVRSTLYHVSLVEEPAYSDALITSARHKVEPSPWAARAADLKKKRPQG